MKQRLMTAYAMTYQPEGYKELIAYQLAFNEAMRLHWLLPPMLAEEEDLLVAKLIEGSRLVCAYLAEAWEYRRCRDAFVAKLSEASAKAATVQTWIAFAVECGYLKAEDAQVHRDLYSDVLIEIGRLINTATVVVNLVG
ncbi:MAG: four helix bundle protein [Phormidesmis priestleyi]|uniref:Four helix bundle protein n=1 Tax=Phormidesmis priestleyi TaxID=268141 RepID=A0A2W4XRD6_9CYAN|nr:MAG: four helix bundle protein [Phormidesmis priestleyi]